MESARHMKFAVNDGFVYHVSQNEKTGMWLGGDFANQQMHKTEDGAKEFCESLVKTNEEYLKAKRKHT